MNSKIEQKLSVKQPGVRRKIESVLPSLDRVMIPLERSGFPHQPEAPGYSIPGTLENLDHLLNKYGIQVSHDVITKSTTLTMEGVNAASDGMQEALLNVVMSLAALNRMPTSSVSGFITALAKNAERNCAEEWIRSKPWDGVDRVPAIIETVKPIGGYCKYLKEALIHKWLRSMVAAATTSGFSARGVLTFQGNQGVGKTSWFRKLVDDSDLRERVLKVDHHLDVHSKDSKLGAIKHWAVELGELDSSIGRDFARLKGFLTSDSDKIRKPYARMESEYQRRTVFFASVNEFNFLEDSTGNTRFWTIPVESIDYQHDIDMQQLFAQLDQEVQCGGTWWLDRNEEALLEYENRKHRSVTALRGLFEEKVDVACIDRSECEAYTATEVLKKLGFLSPTNPQAKECARLLRELYGAPKKIRDRDRWRVPFLADNLYGRYGQESGEDDPRF